MKSTIGLGAIAGIRVGIHYSWFAVLGLFSWYISRQLLPDGYLLAGRDPGWTTATYWATGVIVALLLFLSVLIHEMAHSLVARARGFPVEGITLFLLGGVSNLGREAKDARDEFVISAVGPAASLLLFGLLWLVVLAAPGEISPSTAVIRYVRFINLGMAVFNLLPAFPMDGGRVLRSVVWAITGSMARATNVASRGGQIIGMLLIGLGVFEVFGGNVLAGVWAAFIGWFLFSSATRIRSEPGPQLAVEVVHVKDVMERDPTTIEPDMSVTDAMFMYILQQDKRSLPVCQDGRLVGMLTLADVNRIPRDDWRAVTVREGMTPMPLWSLHPEDGLPDALALLAEHSINQVPVVAGKKLVGLVSRADLIDYLHAHGTVVGGARLSATRKAAD